MKSPTCKEKKNLHCGLLAWNVCENEHELPLVQDPRMKYTQGETSP